jgi:ubiquinone/menaquinone biosynthesis C-methylase UbiE
VNARTIQTESAVWGLSYPDFVAFLRQDNSPAGGVGTIRWWVKQSEIGSRSTVLDLACSTGYSGCQIAVATGCRLLGIDLSMRAVAEARRRATLASIAKRASFCVGDAARLPIVTGECSHVVAGACFGFFSDRPKALAEVARVLRPRGVLALANYFYVKAPPRELQARVAECLGFHVSPAFSYNYWSNFFGERFEIAKEQRHALSPLATETIKRQVAYQVAFCAHWNDAVRRAVASRLLRDRLAFNEHRRYQAYSRTLWSRRES